MVKAVERGPNWPSGHRNHAKLGGGSVKREKIVGWYIISQETEGKEID